MTSPTEFERGANVVFRKYGEFYYTFCATVSVMSRMALR